MEKKIQVFITDDHQMIVEGITSLLQDEESIEIAGTASNGNELIAALKEIHADVILLDVDMPGLNGLEAAKKLLDWHPGFKIIILTVYNDLNLFTTLKEIGCKGYLLKNSSKEELALAIKNVYNGKTCFSSEITESIYQSLKISSIQNPELKELTHREIEILKLIAKGHSNTVIGSKLFISPKTVDKHRTNIMKKIKANNVAGVIRFAIKCGLVD